MALVAFKRRLEQEPIDLDFAYIDPPPDTSIPREATEAVRTITSTGPTGQIGCWNHPERAVLTSRKLNQVGHSKGAETAEHSNQRHGLLQSTFETTKRTVPSQSPNHPNLAVTFKFPRSERCSFPGGTFVNYMPRRSITSRGYEMANTVEALSLLADISCEMKRTHIQRSCNVSPRLSESKGHVNAHTAEALSLLADVSCEFMKRTHIRRSRNLTPKRSGTGTYKEHSDQTPLQKRMAPVLKNLNQLKEHYTDQHSGQLKITDSYRVMRKVRTPRRPSLPAFRCPTKLRKNISLSKCDEIVSRTWTSIASLADTADLQDGLVVTDTSVITSAEKDMPGKGKFPDDKSMPDLGSTPLAAQRTMTLERVSKSSCQISGTKKRPPGGSKRAERITNQILQFIGEMTVSEKLVRHTFGNNPDTSKALRLLLTEHKVKRLGSGGRGQPYEYMATEKGLLHIHGLKQAVSAVVELTPESVSSCNQSSSATIISDAPRCEAQCLPTQVTNSPEVLLSDTNGSWPSSVTPPCCLQWPLTHTVNCVLSSESLDLRNSGITQC